MLLRIIILFINGIFCVGAFASNPVFHYEPEIVTLTGTMHARYFPPPPAKEDIGDKAEVYRYLKLGHTIDVLPKRTDLAPDNDVLKNVEEVQIVKIEESNLKDRLPGDTKPAHSNWSNKFIGRRVCVTGVLYSRVVRIVMLAKHFAFAGDKSCGAK